MKTPWVNDVWLLVFSGSIIAVDQLTKHLVRSHLALGQSWSPWAWLAPYARILRTQNTGMAFSMLTGFSWVFTVFGVIVSIGIMYYYPRISPQDWLTRLALILLLAGAVGNLIDRVIAGQVTDFISVGNFAIFNVADACVNVGVVLLLIGLYIQERRGKSPF